MNFIKEMKKIKAEIKAGRKTMKDLENMRKKWEEAGSPGLERK